MSTPTLYENTPTDELIKMAEDIGGDPTEPNRHLILELALRIGKLCDACEELMKEDL